MVVSLLSPCIQDQVFDTGARLLSKDCGGAFDTTPAPVKVTVPNEDLQGVFHCATSKLWKMACARKRNRSFGWKKSMNFFIM